MSVPLDAPLSKNEEINHLAAFQRFLPLRSNVPETAGREQSRSTQAPRSTECSKTERRHLGSSTIEGDLGGGRSLAS